MGIFTRQIDILEYIIISIWHKCLRNIHTPLCHYGNILYSINSVRNKQESFWHIKHHQTHSKHINHQEIQKKNWKMKKSQTWHYNGPHEVCKKSFFAPINHSVLLESGIEKEMIFTQFKVPRSFPNPSNFLILTF